MLLNLLEHWWLFTLSPLIVLAILWYEFCDWRGALFPLLGGGGATIAMTLGVMGLTQFKLTTMMALTSCSRSPSASGTRCRSPGASCRSRPDTAISGARPRRPSGRTMAPATLSIITDMVGFATLTTVDISFYKAYAYFGMFGMLTLLFTTTILIPLLMWR